MFKRILKAIFCIAVGLACGYGIGTGIHYWLVQSGFILGEWKGAPVVVICENSTLEEGRLQIALDFWDRYGYSHAFFHKDITKLCKDREIIYGFILINDGSVPGGILAQTRRAIIGTEVVGAYIVVPNENTRLSKLIEHELGHAFGLGHYEETGHIMNPVLDRALPKFWIPE